jgi:hypothetical protein
MEIGIESHDDTPIRPREFKDLDVLGRGEADLTSVYGVEALASQ